MTFIARLPGFRAPEAPKSEVQVEVDAKPSPELPAITTTAKVGGSRASYGEWMRSPAANEAYVKYPESYVHNADLLLTDLRKLREQGLSDRVATFLEKRLLRKSDTTKLMNPVTFSLWRRGLARISTALTRRDEPTDLNEIRARRPAAVELPPMTLTREQLRSRIEAAWTGRVCGNLLGKPVEGWPREKIAAFLEEKGHDELRSYMDGTAADHEKWTFHNSWPRSLINNVKGAAPRDDDLDYPVLNLMVLEALLETNPNLTPKTLMARADEAVTPTEIFATWQKNMPNGRFFTAELMALLNAQRGVHPDKAGAYANGFSEWIGAAIRADLWGYICPGDPEKAATLAHHDAAFSHTGNGVYSEMFFAALIAASFNAKNMDQALDAAVAQIPVNSRFAKMVNQVRSWEKSGLTWDQCWTKITEAHEGLHWVHSLNNGAIALAGLLYGKKNFGDVITKTVAGGYDTDSNGATVGSVYGAMYGKIPQKWVAPITRTAEDGSKVAGMNCAVYGHSYVTIPSLVDRVMKFAAPDEA